jgi:TatD DNase family protein
MLVDSHCHLDMLDLSQHDNDLKNVIQAARENDVGHILNVCVTIENFPRVLKIAEMYDDVSCTVGLHPSEQNCHEPSVDELVELAKHKKVIAIGETGLDYFHCEGDLSWQHDRFRRHIQAAKIVNKPLIIHVRQAHEDALRILREEGAAEIGGVFHCFTESWEIAQKVLDLNFCLGITGIVTFKKALELQDVAKRASLDRLLIETDAPYLAPAPKRGKSNEPAYVRYVAEFLASLREISYEEIAKQTTENFTRVIARKK